MAEFKRERVLFHVIGQGSIEIEYEVGAETPEERFRKFYDKRPRELRLAELLRNADDFDHVLTVSTEPTQDDYDDGELRHHLRTDHGVYNIARSSRPQLDYLHEQAHVIRDSRVTRAREDDCPDCEGTGMVMHGPNEVTCGTCEGAKTYGGQTEVDRAVEIATGEGPPF